MNSGLGKQALDRYFQSARLYLELSLNLRGM
jgi:hypothetical protein